MKYRLIFCFLGFFLMSGIAQSQPVKPTISQPSNNQICYLKYADEIGLHHVIKELNTLHQTSGDPFWKPSKLLEDYALAGKNLNS